MNDFARYLAAKRSVDDRALNRRVWERLRAELRERGASVTVADVGAGIGTGAARMSDWGLVDAGVSLHYTAVEPSSELLAEARGRRASGTFASTAFVSEDLAHFAATRSGDFDLVVAHAVLDILDLRTSIDDLVRLLGPGGLLYLPITFDGETSFEPAHQDDADVLAAYHATMESRGSSRTGRRLFHALREHAMEVLEMGSSDWIVHPVGRSSPASPAYPEDEAFFLRFILRTVEGAVRGRTDAARLERWVADRLRRVDDFDLVYIAHQVDVLARKRA